MNAVVEMKPNTGALALTQNAGRMAVAEIISHVAMVQEVMRAVMKPDVHYGKIPGAGDRLTLFKPGAEVLCMAFRIADTYHIEDLSTDDKIRYRVTCIGTHQGTGTVLGSGMGEAMTSEEKYKWRKAICTEEFEATPAHFRRKKFGKAKGGGFYMQEQVRTEQDDLANTVLKMANKRAKIAMTINVTACGDMFGQDLEDMDLAMREHLTRHEGEEGQPAQGAQPEKQGQPIWPEEAFAKQLPKFRKALEGGKTADEVIAWAQTKGQLTESQLAEIRKPVTPAAAEPSSDAPTVTAAEVEAGMRASKTVDALNEAAGLMNAIKDEAQRKPLETLYDELAAKFNNAE